MARAQLKRVDLIFKHESDAKDVLEKVLVKTNEDLV